MIMTTWWCKVMVVCKNDSPHQDHCRWKKNTSLTTLSSDNDPPKKQHVPLHKLQFPNHLPFIMHMLRIWSQTFPMFLSD